MTAAGTPVVSNDVGREGLEAEPFEHLLAAESPAEWIEAMGA